MTHRIRQLALPSFACLLLALAASCGGLTPTDSGAEPLTIDAVTPANGSIDGGNTVTLRGRGFKPGTTVLFGDTPAMSVTVTGANLISAVAPKHIGGYVPLSVVLPDGRTLRSAMRYHYDDGVTVDCAGCWDY